MKLTVEVSDTNFKYSYEVGEEKHTAEKLISVDGMVLFVDLLRQCSKHWHYEREEEFKKSWARIMFDPVLKEKGLVKP